MDTRKMHSEYKMRESTTTGEDEPGGLQERSYRLRLTAQDSKYSYIWQYCSDLIDSLNRLNSNQGNK